MTAVESMVRCVQDTVEVVEDVVVIEGVAATVCCALNIPKIRAVDAKTNGATPNGNGADLQCS